MKTKHPFRKNHAPTPPANPGQVDCIGRCGIKVNASEIGCDPCLARLPEELLFDLRDSYARHQVAIHMRDQMRARAWYCGNPAPLAATHG